MEESGDREDEEFDDLCDSIENSRKVEAAAMTDMGDAAESPEVGDNVLGEIDDFLEDKSDSATLEHNNPCGGETPVESSVDGVDVCTDDELLDAPDSECDDASPAATAAPGEQPPAAVDKAGEEEENITVTADVVNATQDVKEAEEEIDDSLLDMNEGEDDLEIEDLTMIQYVELLELTEEDFEDAERIAKDLGSETSQIEPEAEKEKEESSDQREEATAADVTGDTAPVVVVPKLEKKVSEQLKQKVRESGVTVKQLGGKVKNSRALCDSVLRAVWEMYEGVEGVGLLPPLHLREPRVGENLQLYVDSHHPLYGRVGDLLTRVREAGAGAGVLPEQRRLMADWVNDQWGGQPVNPLANLSSFNNNKNEEKRRRLDTGMVNGQIGEAELANINNSLSDIFVNISNDKEAVLKYEQERRKVFADKWEHAHVIAVNSFNPTVENGRKRKFDATVSSKGMLATVTKSAFEERLLQRGYHNNWGVERTAEAIIGVEEVFKLKRCYGDGDQSDKITEEEMEEISSIEDLHGMIKSFYGDPFKDEDDSDDGGDETANGETEADISNKSVEKKFKVKLLCAVVIQPRKVGWFDAIVENQGEELAYQSVKVERPPEMREDAIFIPDQEKLLNDGKFKVTLRNTTDFEVFLPAGEILAEATLKS